MAVLSVCEKKEVCACRYLLPVASQQIIGNLFFVFMGQMYYLMLYGWYTQ